MKKPKNIFVKNSIDLFSLSHTLIHLSKYLKDIEYVVFFGSLLGLIRDDELIDGDDDIDLLVNFKYKNNIIKSLKESNVKFNLNSPVNSSKYFLQGKYQINKKDVLVDIYFFEYLSKEKIILKSIKGPLQNNKKFWLYFDSKSIFPVEKFNYKNTYINIPQNPKKILKHLYGKTWKIRLKKHEEYFQFFLLNKPRILRNNFLISFVKFLKHKDIKKLTHSLIHSVLNTKIGSITINFLRKLKTYIVIDN